VLALVFVVVETALLTFVIRYRRRGRPRDAEPEQIHGDTRIEIAWTVAPVLLLAVIVAFVFYKLPGIKNAPRPQQTPTSRSRHTSSTGCSSTRAAASRSTSSRCPRTWS
jgi:Heme/copper-type cytochrome/quinol oxidases, subunit 2